MSSLQGEDFQDLSRADDADQPEVELEAGPRAERPNFLTASRFQDFDLPQEILDGLDKAGFEYCTPIQAQAIPVALKGDDIAGQAQTGTGKTTAFLVPLLTRLLKNKPMEPGVPRAIIVTPTRELALQIHQDALVLAGATELRQVLVIGGMDYKEQADLLASGPEIVICTPGRIIDYLQQGVFKTKGIEVAVVDEADRLLDMGFIKDLKYLLGKLPPYSQRQTMLFSATLDERVLELTYQYMNPPQYITAEPDPATKVNIAQELYHVGRDEKLPLLMGLLRREEHQRVIIFANTKSGVEWLSKKLTMNGFQAEGITGDLPQPRRLKLMEAFKENRLQILVATDVASRGIHVDDVSHVYNYDLPQDAENYVHRIGRTARAGNAGKAVSFGCEDYVFHLEAIENLLGEKIPVFWADQDIFQPDQGGEVRLKERRGSSDKRRPAKGGRGESGGDGERRPLGRGPAKSQRPGGIFGLSPRIGADGAEDARQTLAWDEGLVPDKEPLAVAEAEVLTEASSVQEGAEAREKSGEGREGGRRRKRRRGRRGRPGEGGQEGAIAETAAGSQESAAARSGAAEAAVGGSAADGPEAAPAKAGGRQSQKPRRSAGRKAAEGDGQAVADGAPAAPESQAAEKESTEKGRKPSGKKTKAGETKKTAEAAPAEGAEAAEAAPKPARARKSAAPAARPKKADKSADAPEVKAEAAPGPESAPSAAEKKPARKPRAAKAAAPEAAPGPEAAEKEAAPKKTRAAAPRKKAEAESPESPAKAEKAAPKPRAAKKTAAKAEAPQADKKAAETAGGEEAPKKAARKSPARKKAEEPGAEAAPKAAPKKAPARKSPARKTEES